MSYGIFIVEDDTEIAELLSEYLNRYGFKVTVCRDFTRIVEEFLDSGAGLVLLDITLPSYDGFFWCKKLRSRTRVPIIFLSARSMDYDQIYAMECGGDDYIIKPFSYELVTARVNAQLRRCYGEYASDLSEALRCREATLYPSRLKLEYRGNAIGLSKNETEILRTLFTAWPRCVKREELLKNLWDDEDFVEENTLSVNIRRARNQLKLAGCGLEIKTVRGIGYVLEESDA